MPRMPRRGCAYGMCNALAVEGSRYCEKHRKLVNKRYNQYERSNVTNIKYGRAWKRIRDRYIYEHPFCEKCFAEGKLTAAREVHHILPISQGGTHAPDNLMSLCQSCHTKIHMEIGDRQIRR